MHIDVIITILTLMIGTISFQLKENLELMIFNAQPLRFIYPISA